MFTLIHLCTTLLFSTRCAMNQTVISAPRALSRRFLQSRSLSWGNRSGFVLGLRVFVLGCAAGWKTCGSEFKTK